MRYFILFQTTRTENPDIVCALRSKEEALQQMAMIKSQRTEQEKVEMRKSFGLREDENPLLHVSIPADLYMCIPLEVLHTLLLGTCKHILKIMMPEFSPKIRKEILARIKAFNTSGFSTKMYGNVCQYYNSFVGRDFKAWTQMCAFILWPYLSDGYKEVLLAHLKVCVIIMYIIVDTFFPLRFLRLRIAISLNHLLRRNGTSCALNLFKL